LARSSWKFTQPNRTSLNLSLQLRILRFFSKIKNRHLLKEKNWKYKVKKLRRNLKRGFFSRSLPITKSILRCTVYIHKGNIFKKLFLNSYLIGKKLGEFAYTRKPFKYPIKKKKKKKFFKTIIWAKLVILF
jgi:ribosomal protein S19